MLVTPREEEPQINVTMANVFIPFPGASVRDVEQMVTTPAEQVLSQITGVEHVMSISKPGVAVLAVQFKVGVPRIEALVRLYDAVNANADWLPRGLGVGPPLIKPRGIDDVPIVALTLYAKDRAVGAQELERVAHSLEIDLKRVPGTREVVTLGGPGRAALVELDPQRMASAGVTVAELRQALQAANMGAPVGELLGGNRSVAVEAGPYLRDAQEVGELVVGVRNGKPIYLQEVATVREGVPPAKRYVWHGVGGAEPAEYPAVTIQISKKPGENAIDVANGVLRRVDELRNTVIPAGGGGGPEPQLRHHGQRQGPGADPQAAVRHRLRGGPGLPHAGAARGGHGRGRRGADAGGHLVRVLGLGLHAQPGVAVRPDLLHRHPGGRRHRRGGEHPPAAAAPSRKDAVAADPRARWTRWAARPCWPR